MSTLPKLITLIGPTASGKTGLSLDIAKKTDGYVISADSRQVYKEMDIGTAKIPLSEGYKKFSSQDNVRSFDVPMHQGIPHFLIDHISPTDNYTLADFQKDTFGIIKDYNLQDLSCKLPILVGGTGLYNSAIVDNYTLPESSSNSELRPKLLRELEENGLFVLWEKLISLDPLAEEVIDKDNPQRVIRALEVVLSTGESITKQQKKGPKRVDALQIGITMDREALYKRIDKRVLEMVDQGLENEVRSLLEKYDPKLSAFSGIGYRQMIQYIYGTISLDEAIRLIQRDTRRYAKRQMTWFKRDKRIHWIKEKKEALELVKNFLQK